MKKITPRVAASLPERIADRLMARIFFQEWPAGQRLPAERELAAELGVDRTSLRSALAQLQRMKLIEIVQGSGATVKDLLSHAGIEFFAAIFAQDELVLPPSYLAEAFEAWVAIMPWVVESACERASIADFRRLQAIFDRQRAVKDLDRVVELEMEAQQTIVSFVGNSLIVLLFNSTAPIRRRLVRFIVGAIDTEAHIDGHRRLVEALVLGQLPRNEVAALYRAHLQSFASRVRDELHRPQPRQRRRK